MKITRHLEHSAALVEMTAQYPTWRRNRSQDHGPGCSEADAIARAGRAGRPRASPEAFARRSRSDAARAVFERSRSPSRPGGDSSGAVRLVARIAKTLPAKMSDKRSRGRSRSFFRGSFSRPLAGRDIDSSIILTLPQASAKWGTTTIKRRVMCRDHQAIAGCDHRVGVDSLFVPLFDRASSLASCRSRPISPLFSRSRPPA